MRCPRCQLQVAEGAQYCGSCGAATHDPSHASTQIDYPQQTNSNLSVQATDEQNPPRPDPRLGLILDSKYQLIARLGEGGMGTVYRAKRLHIGDEVAVKLLHRDLVREDKAIERFRREAQSAAMIRHQNVVSIHDFSDAADGDGEAYIVMELLHGESLRQLLERRGRMSPEHAVTLMHDICAGVAVAHRQGLLHRDLKPDNVIVTPPAHEGEREIAKVVDFGLAKVRDVAAATALTQSGAVLGTLYYMSPEQCADEELDPRADVYSLGAMFYEMLTGAPPFRSGNLAGLIAKHLNEPPPPFPDSLHIPPALAAACYRALGKKREQRQLDAAAFSRELEMGLSAASGGPTAISAGPSTSRSSWLKWTLVAFGGMLSLLLIVGFVVALKYGLEYFKANSNQSVNSNSTQQTTTSPTETATNTNEATTNINAGDLRGTWTGTYGPLGQPATLNIKNHKVDKFDGVLEQGGIRVAFRGTFNSSSGAITMKQSAVLSGEGWSLGEDTGTLSADGQTMSGSGKDSMGGALGITYPWSFTKRVNKE
jgi:serine/threonine protein kinase